MIYERADSIVCFFSFLNIGKKCIEYGFEFLCKHYSLKIDKDRDKCYNQLETSLAMQGF